MKTRRSARLAATRIDSDEEEDAKVEEPVAAVSEEVEKLPDVLSLGQEPESKRIVSHVDEVLHMASSLDPGVLPKSYFSCDGEGLVSEILRGRRSVTGSSRGTNKEDSIMKKSVLTPDFEQKECAPPISRSKYSIIKEKKMARGRSAGEKWFDMAAPTLTPSLKQDLKLLRMRNVLDPARHYKASDMDKHFPRYFQVGRVLASHADFYSSRIPRKAQKQTLVDELLSDEQLRQYQLKKYREFQDKNSSGSHRLTRIKFKRKFKSK